MRGWQRGSRALPVYLLLAAIAPTACGGSGGGASHRRPPGSTQAGPVIRAIAAPAAVHSGTSPQPNGTLWVLAGTARVRTINELDLPARHEHQAVGVSRDARAIAQSSTGTLALGLGTSRTGAVELLSASTGAVNGTIAVGAPVISLAFGDDGVTLYVLDGTSSSRSVTVINTSTDKVTASIGMPSDAHAIVPAPNQKAIWSVQASGVVQETSLANDKPIESFSTGDPGIAIATSPGGGILYVMKGMGAVVNVAVISVQTERVTRILPSPSHSVALATSLNGSQLYEFVGTPAFGNVQVLDL
jgi:YVTN family beta-propeller protein